MSNNNNKKDYQILIVDDEPLIRESLYEVFRIEGYSVQMAFDGKEAIEILKKSDITIVITDLKLPKMDGLELLRNIKKDYSDIEVILITGYGSIETAVDAMKKGAFDYISKPINDNEIKIIISKIIDKKKLIEENQALRERIAKEIRSSFCGMIGGSEKMQTMYHIVDSVATSNATVLITGESGTGKGLTAKAIHQSDRNRKDKPFVEISCGAISETLLESELFGHVKGSFTGAIKDKEGRFEYAQGGTIFLDEIDAFSLGLQVKLLRVLQDGGFERVGDNVTRTTDARIIVATNQNLSELVKKGEFREDLYYRINVIGIQMPPLRERREDIINLAHHFLKKYARTNNKSVNDISKEVQKMFFEYFWPGNIRELENAIEGAVIMAKTEVIQKWDIPHGAKFKLSEKIPEFENKLLRDIVEQPEREHIVTVLKKCHWSRHKAAATLGINRTTLYNKMKKYNISEKIALR